MSVCTALCAQRTPHRRDCILKLHLFDFPSVMEITNCLYPMHKIADLLHILQAYSALSINTAIPMMLMYDDRDFGKIAPHEEFVVDHCYKNMIATLYKKVNASSDSTFQLTTQSCLLIHQSLLTEVSDFRPSHFTLTNFHRSYIHQNRSS